LEQKKNHSSPAKRAADATTPDFDSIARRCGRYGQLTAANTLAFSRETPEFRVDAVITTIAGLAHDSNLVRKTPG
jgi:hypothetical protein